MNIMLNENWQQTVCSALLNENYLQKNHIVLSAYPDGWNMKIPVKLLNNEIIKKVCANGLNQYTIYRLTDSNWNNGISKDGLILLLKNNFTNSRIIALDKLELASGEMRTVVKIETISDKYLYVYIDSPIFELNSNVIKIKEGK